MPDATGATGARRFTPTAARVFARRRSSTTTRCDERGARPPGSARGGRGGPRAGARRTGVPSRISNVAERVLCVGLYVAMARAEGGYAPAPVAHERANLLALMLMKE